MTALSQSSGDLLADRRFAWAMALVEEGDIAGAADLLDQVAAMAPRWAPAWSALGDARARLDEREAALRAWRSAAALDPQGRLGAALKMARLDGPAPEAVPDAYVAALFDDYAPRFERHLREALHYRGPEILVAALEGAAPGRRFSRALDLGCGTGLMGRALAGRVEMIDGVDLSAGMVARARDTGCYAALRVASIAQALAGAAHGAYDLVTAADVLVYVGDLSPILASIAEALAPGGLVAFTTEAQSGPAAFALGADLRFAHSRRHIEDAIRTAGLIVRRLDEVSTRSEKRIAVPGLLALARRPDGI